jgi:hypothetical protein
MQDQSLQVIFKTPPSRFRSPTSPPESAPSMRPSAPPSNAASTARSSPRGRCEGERLLELAIFSTARTILPVACGSTLVLVDHRGPEGGDQREREGIELAGFTQFS